MELQVKQHRKVSRQAPGRMLAAAMPAAGTQQVGWPPARPVHNRWRSCPPTLGPQPGCRARSSMHGRGRQNSVCRSSLGDSMGAVQGVMRQPASAVAARGVPKRRHLVPALELKALGLGPRRRICCRGACSGQRQWRMRAAPHSRTVLPARCWPRPQSKQAGGELLHSTRTNVGQIWMRGGQPISWGAPLRPPPLPVHPTGHCVVHFGLACSWAPAAATRYSHSINSLLSLLGVQPVAKELQRRSMQCRQQAAAAGGPTLFSPAHRSNRCSPSISSSSNQGGGCLAMPSHPDSCPHACPLVTSPQSLPC